MSPPSRRRKALLYILNSGNLYGTERMALATLQGLDEYDVRVVFAPPSSGADSVATAARAAGYRSVTFDTRPQFVGCLLPWLLRYREIDMIGTQVGQAFIAHYLAKLFFVRLRQLQVVHGGTEDEHAYGRKRRLNGIPVGVVAVSPYVRQKLVDHGIRARAIHVVENFLARTTVDQPVRRPAYAPSVKGARPVLSPVRVAVVSRIDPIKRVDLLVEAIERHGLTGFQFDVFGAGEDLDALRTRAARFPNICFHGFVSDVQQRFTQADFLLHLCPVEPFGMVVLEAFLGGLVVIVPNAGGAGGLVDDGVDGLRFGANDVDALAAVLMRARSLPADTLQGLAEAALVKLASYSPEKGQGRYREAFNAVAQLN